MKTKTVTVIKARLATMYQNFSGLYLLYPCKYTITSIETESWEYPYIKHLRSYDQKNIRGESADILPIENNQLTVHQENIRSAITLIQDAEPEFFAEFKEFVTHIKLFRGKVLRGDTSPRTFGAIWLRVPHELEDQVGYWIEHIVHEFSHLRLEALFFHDKIVLNPSSQKEFRAPIRDDLRPMRGIFHATFVLKRMVSIFKKLSMMGMDIRFRDRLQLCKLQLEIGLDTVYSEKAKLTTVGERIRDSFNDLL
ncbi:HEXXH motif-containing putative peptide modification protein [Okeania sp. SIO2B3]|uniref:aKG-HExxH-type peptide beta-hydroxylase n=1 Tax=Okeania sp. SIO2B3 TaxID=2607784 RepID=UPI0013C1CEBF|nr:HEXXH motif-containing putative peptide modification protein [Okeania sp. SIO2B3]NET44744.1 hypothetical protein [Okeania sp. SIO2B3]